MVNFLCVLVCMYTHIYIHTYITNLLNSRQCIHIYIICVYILFRMCLYRLMLTKLDGQFIQTEKKILVRASIVPWSLKKVLSNILPVALCLPGGYRIKVIVNLAETMYIC